MIQLEIKALKELLPFYSRYVAGEGWVELKELAEEIYNEYHAADVLLSKTVSQAVGPLLGFFAINVIPIITRERAKEILDQLKKREAELNKKNG